MTPCVFCMELDEWPFGLICLCAVNDIYMGLGGVLGIME